MEARDHKLSITVHLEIAARIRHDHLLPGHRLRDPEAYRPAFRSTATIADLAQFHAAPAERVTLVAPRAFAVTAELLFEEYRSYAQV